MNIRTYIAFFKLSIKDYLAYFKDYLLSTFGRIILYTLMIFVWNIVYVSSHITSIAGFSLVDINAYFVIGGAAFFLINSINDNILSDDIKTGSISRELIKPTHYPLMVFIQSLADNILVVPPVLIVIILAIHLLGLSITLLEIVGFVATLIIGYFIINLIQFMIGSFAIYTTSALGFSILSFNIMSILGGAIMPLSFFPSYISNITSILPFQFFIYLPTSILLGLTPPSAYIHYITLGIIWLLGIAIVTYLFWGRVKKKLSTAGG